MARKTLQFLYANSALLVLGAIVALMWANLGHDSYHAVQHALHFPVNDVLMAFFFGIAFKEVYEAIVLPGGSLRNVKKAAVPLLATLGGILGPIVVFLVTSAMFDLFEELSPGWAIPTATDIAFSYLIAKRIWREGNPAISFLLLLAIADDATGLGLIAVFYPQKPLEVWWMLLVGLAMLLAWWMHHKWQLISFWPYLSAGAISWFGFYMAGLHPALGLIPVIPFMPHADTDLGIFAAGEDDQHDTLNEFEHFFKKPVEWILLLFGLANAGVELGSVSEATTVTLLALMIGKPFGIFLFGWAAKRILNVKDSISDADLLLVGIIAGIGFTVALFVAGVAYPAGPIQDAAKMGALLSVLSGVLALVVTPILRRNG